MQLGAKRRKGILERGRIHHGFELECEGGRGHPVRTFANELPLLIAKRAAEREGGEREGEGCSLRGFVGDVNERGGEGDGFASFLHLWSEGEEKKPAIRYL